MTTSHVFFAILVGPLAALVGCSSNVPAGGGDVGHRNAMSGVGGGTGQAGAGNGGTDAAVDGQPSPTGVGGQAGAAGTEPTATRTPCATSEDCDDGKACDGQEACVAGFCAMGEPVACDPNLECSESERGKCVFADESPWIVYQADDDTPGVPELYAVKRGLLGKMTPIKLNDELEPGWKVAYGGRWSPDHQLYAFVIEQTSPYATATEIVRFGHGMPEKAVRIPGDYIQWAPSGRAFSMSEESGISIYDHATDGTFNRAFSVTDPDYENGYGEWTPSDQFVFSITSKLTKAATIQLASAENGSWGTSTLVPLIAQFWLLAVSPTGTEFVYQQHDSESGDDSPLYVVRTEPGSTPKILSAAARESFRWSPDGSKYLLVESGDSTRAYLGTGSAYDRRLTEIAPNEVISGTNFTPDSKQVILWEPSYEWAHDVKLLDPAKGTDRSYDTIARNGLRDRGPYFAPDQDLAAIPERDDSNTQIWLSLFSLSGRRRTARIDSIAPNTEFGNVRISAHNEFLAYSKGVSPDYDGAYVDLRYDTVDDPKPVRLPGDGTLRTFNFDSSGTALYYIRERDNGARDCYYLDLSRQVAQPPVKVNRDGRTDYCTSQSLTP